MNWIRCRSWWPCTSAARRPSARDSAAWTPNVDLLETGSAYLIVVELPGLGRTISRSKRPPTSWSSAASAPPRIRRRALPPPRTRHGRFTRSFAFGEPVDAARIVAAFDAACSASPFPRLPARPIAASR